MLKVPQTFTRLLNTHSTTNLFTAIIQGSSTCGSCTFIYKASDTYILQTFLYSWPFYCLEQWRNLIARCSGTLYTADIYYKEILTAECRRHLLTNLFYGLCSCAADVQLQSFSNTSLTWTLWCVADGSVVPSLIQGSWAYYSYVQTVKQVFPTFPKVLSCSHYLLLLS